MTSKQYYPKSLELCLGDLHRNFYDTTSRKVLEYKVGTFWSENVWGSVLERVLEREIKQKSVVGILILLTLMNGDVATVNNDELSDIQYIKCTYYWIEYIRSKRIDVYGHACTWLRDRKSTWDDTITLQHENTTTKPIITNIDKVTQQSENVGIFIKRTVPRALFAYWFSLKFGELNCF